MERVDANLIPFAKNNPSGYRFAFGTDTATDDINVNYNDNIKKGWGTTPNEFPEVEDFNAMAYTASYLTAYLYQMGISEWNNKQNYRQYSRVMGSNGIIYKAKTGTDLAPNVNNNPTTDSTNWEIDTQFNINTFTNKPTPIDADNLAIQESGGLFKKTSWANIKATLKTYFDISYVALTENQTIAGIKTFTSSPIVPTPTTSTQVANKAYADTKQTNLGFTPVQQGTGIGQLGNAVKIGWSYGNRTKITIDGTDMGNIVMDGDVGVANSSLVKTALNASGTAAPIYACRAWVNFKGTGTVAIRGSGNVSGITDNGIGDYTVNFIAAMPDANYSLSGTAALFHTVPAAILVEASDGISGTILKTISALRLYTINNNDDAMFDAGSINISIFR